MACGPGHASNLPTLDIQIRQVVGPVPDLEGRGVRAVKRYHTNACKRKEKVVIMHREELIEREKIKVEREEVRGLCFLLTVYSNSPSSHSMSPFPIEEKPTERKPTYT